MGLKKFLKFERKGQRNTEEMGQSSLEYILLVAIAIIALLGANFIINIKNNSFESHFQRAKYFLGGDGF